MKTILAVALLSLTLSASAFAYGQVHVRGYTKSDGTYVAPHVRSAPDNTVTNNYSHPGNYNPNTGSITSGNSSWGNYNPSIR
jgi:hypothetical protein